jgi:ADP-ribosyl-[dinitrogen reductase] hydrolase
MGKKKGPGKESGGDSSAVTRRRSPVAARSKSTEKPRRAISAEARILGGLWGLAVGDALGVPVEFCSREDRVRDPVTDFRGYGTHDQPPGTWSDDTSLTLCTIDALLHSGEDYQAVGKAFVRWSREEIWTPHGRVFDIGGTTSDAIGRLARDVPPLQAGRDDEASNGNGSLMRILPVAFWCANRGVAGTVEAARRFSALTHRHPRSQVGCALFCLIAQRLLAGADPVSAVEGAWDDATQHDTAEPFASELKTYSRIARPEELARLNDHEIQGSGYVVEALEASVWSLLTSHDFPEAVLKAVNLGEDTDTTGAITGALAGVRYGVNEIPDDWRSRLARHDDLDKLFNAFVERIGAPG